MEQKQKANIKPDFVIPKSFPKTYAKTSSIDHGGLGLFAGENIKEGTVVIEYTGKIIPYTEARTLKNRTYLKAITFTKHLDGNVDYASNAKYINDNTDRTKLNVSFVKQKLRVFVTASRDIHKDEELFISYGRGHWVFHEIGGFLGLKTIKEVDGSQRLVATEELDNREVLCVYASALLDDYFHGLGRYVSFSLNPETINCVIRKNPFIPNTLMLTALRKISPDEDITADYSCQLKVVEGNGKDTFDFVYAQIDIPAGSPLGIFPGREYDTSEYEERVRTFPCVSKYAVSVGSKIFIDPTDQEGNINPRRASPVCFVSRPNELNAANAEFVLLRNHDRLYGADVLLKSYPNLLCLVARKDISKRERIVAQKEVELR